VKIVVLVKHVPEPTAIWRFADDLTLDRDAVAGRLSQLDEFAIEQALRVVEAGQPAEITFLTMGPPAAAQTLRNALAIGGDEGVHVLDPALAGSDAVSTALVLARAVQRLGADLVICGMASTDAEMSVVPSMIAEWLGVPQATYASALSTDGVSVSVRRESDAGSEEIVAQLPAVVSVTDRSGEPRYPSFRGIMAAKKKPVQTWSLVDVGVDASQVGLAAAGTVVEKVQPRPPRTAGTVVVDKGDAAAQLADFLVDAKLL
jgi:electron transfer flavoprotein beta subunit